MIVRGDFYLLMHSVIFNDIISHSSKHETREPIVKYTETPKLKELLQKRQERRVQLAVRLQECRIYSAGSLLHTDDSIPAQEYCG